MNFISITLFLVSVFAGPSTQYPTPTKNKNHLFYIQRTHNTNTIIYEANFDEKGVLNPKKPILIHWILFEEDQKIESLSRFERSFAYGIKHKVVENKTGEFDIKIVSYKDLNLRLKQIAPFKAEVIFNQKNSSNRLDHVFINANNAGLWTKVKYLEVFTHIANSTELKQDKIFVD